MQRLYVLALLVVLALPAGPAAGKEYARTLTIREPLGHAWTDELVHRDVTVRERGVAARTFALADAAGNPVPVQVDVLAGKPQAVQRARLWWKMTLPPGANVAYRLTYRDDGRPTGQPATAMAVRRQGDRLTLSTGVSEIVLAAPRKAFAKAVPVIRAPAPILGARPAAGEGPWCGTWRLLGSGSVKAVQAAVEADGPVWARVRLRYVFADTKQRYEMTVRAVADEPWFDLEETYAFPKRGRLLGVLKDDLDPTDAVWLPWFVGDGSLRPAEALGQAPLEAGRTGGLPAVLRPVLAYSAEAAHACLAVSAGEDGDRSAIGAAMIAPADWDRLYDQVPTVRSAAGVLGLEFPVEKGRRRWLLLAGPAGWFDTMATLQDLIRHTADLPLDRVLAQCVLEWDRGAAPPAPHILTTPERLTRLRADLAEGRDTPAARLVLRVLDGEAEGDRALAECLAGHGFGLAAPPIDAAQVLARSYQDPLLAPPAYPQQVAAALAWADLASAGQPAGSPGHALLGYVFTDPNYWPGWSGGAGPATPRDRAVVTAAAYAAAMMPDHPHARRWMAAALRRIRADLRRAAPSDSGVGVSPRRLVETLETALPVLRAAQNAGLPAPAPPAAASAKKPAEPTDAFAWPEVTDALEMLRNLHTPPDARLGRRVLVPTGDAAPWQPDVGRLFGMAAAGLRPIDPRRAALWMGVCRDYYGDDGSGDLAADVLLSDPALPAAPLDKADWPGRVVPGFGAVLRSRTGTPRETFATLRCGGPGDSPRGDEMSFTFFGAGVPLAPAWNTPADLVPAQEHMHNRLNFGEDENMDAPGRLLAFNETPHGIVAVAEARTHHLRRMPRWPEEIGAGASFSRRRLDRPVRYRRYVVLVRHPDGSALEDYLVVRDEPASAEPATFNLFVLARRVQQEDRVFRFEGQLGVDALLFLATPMPESVTLAEWGWPDRGVDAAVPDGFVPGRDRHRQGELQQWVRLRARPGRPFLTVLYPCPAGTEPPQMEPLADGAGVRVTLGRESEDVYLASTPGRGVGGEAVFRRGGKRIVLLRKAEPQQ